MVLRTCVKNLRRHPSEVDLSLDDILDLVVLDVIEAEQTEEAMRRVEMR